MDEYRVPGVAVGLLHEGERYTAGFGVTNVNHPLEVTGGTLFQIGSITKTMTATVLMMLAQAGEVDLDAPVRQYLPTFRVQDEEASAGVTVRNLLTHSAGWVGDFFEDTGAGEKAIERYVALMAGLQQLAPLGRAFSYNNSAFSVAGLVVEKVTGRPYEQAMKELLFDPLGMADSYFYAGDVMVHRFAVGHEVLPDDEVHVAKPWPLPRATYAAGGVVCSVDDLLTYAQFYLDGGKTSEGRRLLSAEAMQTLWAPQLETGEASRRVAHSWFVKEEDGIRIYQHGGGTKGQVSIFNVVPQKQFALVLFTNANRGGLLNEDVVHWALEAYCGVKHEDPQPVEASEEYLSEAVGLYRRPFADLELRLEQGQLRAHVTYRQSFPSKEATPPPPLPPISVGILENGNLLALDGHVKGAQGQIVRDEEGAVGWVRFGGRLYPRAPGSAAEGDYRD